MERRPKTQLEARHEAFEAQAELCRELGDEALRAIDEALAEQDNQWYLHKDLIEQNGIEPDSV